MTRNSFFDLRLQKGFLPGVAGCLEHSALLSEALRDARTHQRAICVSWLDLRNAFGSVRHSLIQFALRHYGLPPHFQRLVFDYYERLFAIVDVPGEFQSKPFHFAIGVFQGCTLSPLLFNIVIQLLLDTLEKPDLQSSVAGYRFSSLKDCSLLSSAYADDIEIVTSSPKENQALLDRTDDFLKWTETMKARPNKCWSVALKRFETKEGEHGLSGYRRFNPNLQISKEPLQYLDDGDFRYLGRPTNVRGCEKLARSEISSKLKEWLLLVDAQHLPKTCKLWLYQHFIVAKMSWYFTALDLTATFVKTLQSVSTKFLKNWSGLPRPANTSILFLGKSGQAGLHITNLVTFWKQMQIVRMDLLKNSADPRCRKLYDAHVQRQSTWTKKFPPAVEHACAATVVEANPPASNQLQSRSVCNKSQASSRKRMLNLVSEVDTEEQLSKLRKLEIQGKFLEWTDVMHSDLTWRRLIFGMSDGELRFSLQAITNTTPTPDNLRRWGNSEIDSACSLCGQTCTLRHVLNACKVSLLQGRYLWRHNLILGCLQKYLLDFWSSVKKENCAATAPFIRLVPEGTKAINLPSSRQTRRPLVSSDLLRCGNDWVFLFDLETGLIFPPEIASTTQRPDIVIYSKSKKIVVLIELTCPLEDRISTAHELKKDRYLELLSNCRCNGWTAFHFPVEVGSRGFVAFSLTSCLQKLGFPSYLAKKARNECSKIALRASYSIYLQRNIREWSGR